MRKLAGMLVLLVLGSMAAFAQDDAGTLKNWDFEDGVQGWTTLDAKGKLKVTNAEDAVFSGKQALELVFPQRLPDSAAPDAIPGTMIVEVEGLPAETKSLRFAVATGYSTPVLVALREKDESLYMAPVWSQEGQWNEVQLALSDLTLSVQDSQDENDKLDLDQVQYLAIADGSVFARAMAKQGIPFKVPDAVEMGVWLDDVVLSSKDPDDGWDPLPAEGAEDIVIDSCKSKTIRWLPLGGDDVVLQSLEDEQDKGQFLQAEFVVPARTVFGLMRNVPRGMLADCEKISMEVKAEVSGPLAIALQQSDGGRYVAIRQIDSKKGWQEIEVAFSDFTVEPGQRAGGRPDPSETAQIGLADILGIMQNVMSANTWQVRNIVAHK